MQIKIQDMRMLLCAAEMQMWPNRLQVDVDEKALTRRSSSMIARQHAVVHTAQALTPACTA
jgi:hypothetical protein